MKSILIYKALDYRSIQTKIEQVMAEFEEVYVEVEDLDPLPFVLVRFDGEER